MNLTTRIMSLAVGLMVAVLPASAQYTVKLPYTNVDVENNNGTAVFKGGSTYEMPGMPALPLYKMLVLLPPNADLGAVSVTVNSPVVQEVTGTFDVQAVKIPDSYGTPKGQTIVNGKNTAVFAANDFFPAAFIGKTSFDNMRQYKIGTIDVYPFRYNPVTKKLLKLTGGTLAVSWSGGSSSASGAARCGWMEKTLREMVVNPEVLEQYGTLPSASPSPVKAATIPGGTKLPLPAAPLTVNGKTLSGIQSVSASATSDAIPPYYIVFMGSDLVGQVPFLSYYLEYWAAKYNGYYAVFTEENFGNPARGQTRCGLMRTLLTTVYAAWNVKNVLIVGDPDPQTGDFPMYQENAAAIPTDYYYADVAGTFPGPAEIAVGRLPVPRDPVTNALLNPEGLSRMTERALAYAMTDAGFNRRHALLPAVPLDASTSAESFTLMQDIKSILDPVGFVSTRLYDPYNYRSKNFIPEIVNQTVTPEEPLCNYQSAVDAWNRVNPGLVVYNTHGSPYDAVDIMRTGGTATVQSLETASPSIVLAMSCETAPPDEAKQDNIGYQTLKYSAVSYIGCSRTLKSGDPVAKAFVAQFTSNTAPGTSVGWALNNAKASAGDNSHLRIFNIYGFPDIVLDEMQIPLISGVPMAAPKITECRPGGTDRKHKIKVVWSTVPGATSSVQYVVERSESAAMRSDSYFTPIATVAHPTNNFVDAGLAGGSKWIYRVFAQNASGRTPCSAMDSSTTDLESGTALLPSAPAGVSATCYSNCAKVAWGAVSGATGYIVKRSSASSGTYYPVKTVGNSPLFYCDSNVYNGGTYYYRVVTINDAGQSANSTAYATAALPAAGSFSQAPLIEYCELNAGNIDCFGITWNKNGDYPMGYEFDYQEKLPDNTFGPFVAVKETYEKKIFTHSVRLGVYGNSRVKIRVKKFGIDKSGVRCYLASALTPEKTTGALSKPAAPGFTVSATPAEHFTCGWTAQPGLQYEVYYKVGAGSWRKSPLVDGSSFGAQVGTGKTVTCCVRSVATVKETGTDITGKVYSDYPAVMTTTTGTALRPPEISVSNPTRNSVSYSLFDMSLAEGGFKIERSTSPSMTSPTEIKSLAAMSGSHTSSATFTDANLTSGTTYYYRAYAYSGSSKYYSNIAMMIVHSNVARLGTASAASSASGYEASKAIDNSTTTRWKANTLNAVTWEVDLSAKTYYYKYSGFEFVWYTTGRWDFTIEGYNPIWSSWIPIATKTNNTVTSTTQYIANPLGLENFQGFSSKLRITVTAHPTNVNPSFFEFRAFADPTPVPAQ